MNKDWLMENADIPIKYILTHNNEYVESFLKNIEVENWLKRLFERSNCNNIGDIH